MKNDGSIDLGGDGEVEKEWWGWGVWCEGEGGE